MDTTNFLNTLELSIIRGDGGTETLEFKNSISDDFLCFPRQVYSACNLSPDMLSAVLLPDGPRWAGWTWDPRDPWVPYPCLANHPADTEAVDIHQPATITWDAAREKSKLYYQWNKLDSDITLKAVGLTNWDLGMAGACGLDQPYASFPIAALAVLPQPLLIRGRNGGTQTPDILQIAYYISLVGV